MTHGFFPIKTRKARNFLGLLVLAPFVLTGQGFAQSDSESANRIKRMENEIETLSRAVYKGEAPPASSYSGSSSASADTEVRLQQLETDIRTLRGTIEEQAFETKQIKEQLERATSDIELRLNDLEGGTKSPPAPASQREGRNTGYDTETDMNAATQVTSETEPASGNGSGYKWGSDTGNKQTTQDLGVVRTASSGASSGDEASTLYENAFSLIKDQNFPAAQVQFKAFLDRYPSHALAGNAKYWLGETYYAKGKYDDAARIFAEGYQKYPKGAKSADNLLKLGLSLDALGKKADACIALKQLQKENVAGSVPVMRQAEQEMTRLGCS